VVATQEHSCPDCIPFAVLYFEGGLISAFSDGDFRLCSPDGEQSTKYAEEPVAAVEDFLKAGAVLFPYAYYSEPWSIES